MANDYRARAERDYREYRENLFAGFELPPGRLVSLPLDAQARINRFTLSGGFIYALWDEDSRQRKLAAAFTPLQVAKNTLESYPKSPLGRTMRNIHELADARKMPNYPTQSDDERYVMSTFRVLVTAATKLGATDALRPLARKELKELLLLHGLSKNASELEVNTGLKKLPF